MTGHGAKFDHKLEAAIAALLTQPTVGDAAREVGISADTLLRWLKVEEFQTAYRAARRDVFRQSVARLQHGTSEAATALLEIVVDGDTPPSVRVRAAEAILNHSLKAIEIEDIDARVAALEAANGGQQK